MSVRNGLISNIGVMKKILSIADTSKIIGMSKFCELQNKRYLRFAGYGLSLLNNNVLWVW
jgi:hypothetical protein